MPGYQNLHGATVPTHLLRRQVTKFLPSWQHSQSTPTPFSHQNPRIPRCPAPTNNVEGRRTGDRRWAQKPSGPSNSGLSGSPWWLMPRPSLSLSSILCSCSRSLARFRGASSSHPTRAQVRDPLSDRFPWCPLSGVLTVVCGNAIAL